MNAPFAIWVHLIRPFLVMLPVGLLLSVIWLDATVLTGAGPGAHELARRLLGVGNMLGLLETFHCGLNWRRVPPGHRARDVCALRCAGATLGLLLQAASWFLRTSSQPASTLAMALALGAVTTLFLTTWLGLEILLRYVVEEPYSRAHHNPTAPLRPTRTMPPMNSPPPFADLTSSVAGEEDPGAAVDAPAPPPRESMPGVATRR